MIPGVAVQFVHEPTVRPEDGRPTVTTPLPDTKKVAVPVPVGGAARLTDALVERLRSRGGEVVCNAAVTSVVVRGGRAVAVRTADGREITAERAVLADVSAPVLYSRLLTADVLPAGLDPATIIKLASNENPWGPSPRAVAAAQ